MSEKVRKPSSRILRKKPDFNLAPAASHGELLRETPTVEKISKSEGRRDGEASCDTTLSFI